MRRDFDFLTCVAAFLAVSILCLIGFRMGESVQLERIDHDANAIHNTTSGPSCGPETHPSGRRATTRPAGQASQAVQNDDGRTGHMGRLFAAIRQVESGDRVDAVGDGGRSLGAYQIGILYWRDAGGKASDYRRLVTDRSECEKIMLAYWARYKAVTDEMRCRLHNGGPAGMKKAATVGYWNKVQGAMK